MTFSIVHNRIPSALNKGHIFTGVLPPLNLPAQSFTINRIGTMGDGEELIRIPAPFAFTLPVISQAYPAAARVAAAAGVTVSLRRNGVEIGTATWAAAGTTVTVVVATATAFAAVSDVFTALGPALADATLADVAIPITYTRS